MTSDDCDVCVAALGIEVPKTLLEIERIDVLLSPIPVVVGKQEVLNNDPVLLDVSDPVCKPFEVLNEITVLLCVPEKIPVLIESMAELMEVVIPRPELVGKLIVVIDSEEGVCNDDIDV